MKKLIQSLVNAFRPASIRAIKADAEREAAELRRIEEDRLKEMQTSSALLRENFAPCIEVLAALPAKDGKKFWGLDTEFHNRMLAAAKPEGRQSLRLSYDIEEAGSLSYGEKPPSIPAGFELVGARKTVFGRTRYSPDWTLRDYLLDSEVSQRKLARMFAKWVYKVAPDRLDEVREALETAANPHARAFAPKA